MEHSDQQILQLFQNTNQKTIQKSPQQLSNIIKIVFSQPSVLVQRLLNISIKTIKQKHLFINNNLLHYQQQHPQLAHPHNLDLQIIKNLFQNIKQLRRNHQLYQCFENTFQIFQTQGKLKEYLKSNKEMLYFFILIFSDDLFTDSKYNLLLKKFLNLIKHTGPYRQILSQWIDDITNQRMTFLVISIQRQMENQFEKLKPNAVDPSLLKYVGINIKNYCSFLQLLNQSNKRRLRIPKQAFINSKIKEIFDPIGQFKLHLKKQTNLNFLDHPFILPIEFKQKMLQIQSLFEQKINMQKSIQQGFENLAMGIPQMDVNGGFSIQGLIFLHFKINRQNILDDSLQKLCKTTKNLKSPMRIQFIGQEGADQGGVKNQYFQLLVKQLFNPYLDMFLPKNKGRVYWFNGYSYQPPIRFQFVGMLLGLAIYNSVLLDIKFPRALYRKILQKDKKQQEQDFSPQVLQDLAQIQPEIADGLNKILKQTDPQALQNLLLFFNIQFQNFGSKQIFQLVEQGNQIPVTADNKQEYVQLYSDYLLNKHSLKQFTAFKRGFNRVVDGQMIHLLQPQQLERIICGSPHIDFKQLQASSAYEGGYTKQSQVIKYLWDVLHSLNQQQKKSFLIFLTGTDRVPIQGLKGLKFVIQKHGSDTNHLPTAHTCFNILLLPEYQSKKKLQEKLKLGMKHNQGFGLI